MQQVHCPAAVLRVGREYDLVGASLTYARESATGTRLDDVALSEIDWLEQINVVTGDDLLQTRNVIDEVVSPDDQVDSATASISDFLEGSLERFA